MTDLPCGECGASYAEDAGRCPFCRAPRALGLVAGGGLARFEEELLQHERGIDRLLARTDELLAREMDREMTGQLSMAELGGALARADAGRVPSLDDLERLVAGDAGVAQIDGISLARLFDQQGDDARLIKRGLSFMRHAKWFEASEWWALQRAAQQNRPRLELLLHLFELWTYELSGQVARAAAVRQELQVEPLVRELRMQPRAGTS